MRWTTSRILLAAGLVAACAAARADVGAKHAIVIGISAYRDASLKLNAAARDAAAMARFLSDEGRTGGFSTQLLTDGDATRVGIAMALKTMKDRSGPNDTLVFFYSGHAFRDDAGAAHLMPVDGNPELLDETAFGLGRVVSRMKEMKGRQKILFLDCCHSGAVGETILAAAKGAADRGLSAEQLRTLAQGSGTAILMSSQPDQLSWEDAGPGGSGLGFFTKHLLDGLDGKADTAWGAQGHGDGDGFVSMAELADYVYYKASADVMQRHGKPQQAELFNLGTGTIRLAVARRPASVTPSSRSTWEPQALKAATPLKEALRIVLDEHVDGAALREDDLVQAARDGLLAWERSGAPRSGGRLDGAGEGWLSSDEARAAINGVLERVGDAYSRYVTPADSRAMRDVSGGSFAGVGMMLGPKDGGMVVIAPIHGSPAARAGVLAGDRVVSIDGHPAAGMAVEEIVQKLRGPAGTQVQLELERSGRAEPIALTLTREPVKIPGVRACLLAGSAIGYLKFVPLTASAPGDVDEAVRRLEKAGARALVLDLRQNPGGLLEAALGVTRLFVSRSRVLSIKAQNGDETPYEAGTAAHPEPGLVVLIDKGTASAAEVVAAALRDAGRGTVVGERSFGKGSAQTLRPLPGGGTLAVTTAYYFTPKGERLQGRGIEPDVPVAMPQLGEEQSRALSEPWNQLANQTSSGKVEVRAPHPADVPLAEAIAILKRWLARPAKKRTHPPR